MVRHMVMMQWHDDTNEGQIQAVHEALATMPDRVPGIVRYEFGDDLGGSEANFDFALVADFDSIEDYETYASHPEHLAVIAEVVRPVVAAAVRVQYEI